MAVADDQRMLDRFVRLCEVASPTGSERAVADALLAELRDLGVDVTEDDSAGPAQAGSGNLIARIPGERDAWAARIETDVKRRVDEATEECKAAPLPPADILTKDVYADGGFAWRN